MLSNFPQRAVSMNESNPNVIMGHWPGPIRIGVYVEQLQVSAWIYEMLVELEESNLFKLSHLIIPCDELVKKRQSGIFQQFVEMLDARFTRSEADAFNICDAEPLLGALPKSMYSGDASWKGIDADVLLFLAPGDPSNVLSRGTRHGVWSLHLLNSKEERIHYWELAKSNPSNLIQQICVQRGDGARQRVLHGSALSPSLTENRNSFAWKSAAYLPRLLKELHEKGDDFHEDLSPCDDGVMSPPKKVGRLDGINLLAKMALKRTSHKLSRLARREQWGLFIAETAGFPSRHGDLKRVFPPRDRFWADPFIVAHEGRRWCFAEELIWEEKKGTIVAFDLDDPKTEAKVVLERPYHLSYPFVFNYDGQFYMIPETRSNRSIEIYEATRFPYEWRPLKPLMTGVEAVDATLHEYEGRWWMFVNMASRPGGSTWDELFIFHAPHPLSQNWVAHPKNPVISDVRCARPAGRILASEDGLVRPAQDCRRRQGDLRPGVHFMQITRLDAHHYEEVELDKLLPDWDSRVKRIHTYNEGGGLMIIDGLMERFF